MCSLANGSGPSRQAGSDHVILIYTSSTKFRRELSCLHIELALHFFIHPRRVSDWPAPLRRHQSRWAERAGLLLSAIAGG